MNELLSQGHLAVGISQALVCVTAAIASAPDICRHERADRRVQY